MDVEEVQARRALAAIPGFSPGTADAARLTRLAGLTNRVYKVEAGGTPFCLRMPGAGTAALIDRDAEEAHARAAAAVGIAPEILYFGPDGVMLTRFVDDAVTLSPNRFRDDPGALRRAAEALRRVHHDAADFTRSFAAFSVIPSYLGLLQEGGVALPPEARLLADRAGDIQLALAAYPAPLKPCHCDPTGGNLLDTSDRVWIVDWEYSAMNDPLWDLAYLALEGDFDEARDRVLLAAYFEREPRPAEAGRMVLHKAVADLLSGLWSLIQQAGANPAADFHADATRRFERGAALVRSPEFTRHLELVCQD